jgi:hypothetical protein
MRFLQLPRADNLGIPHPGAVGKVGGHGLVHAGIAEDNRHTAAFAVQRLQHRGKRRNCFRAQSLQFLLGAGRRRQGQGLQTASPYRLGRRGWHR